MANRETFSVKSPAIVSYKRESLTPMAVVFLILLVVGLSQYVLNRIELRTRQDIAETLRVSLKTTQEALDIWAYERKADARVWGLNRFLHSAVQELLAVPRARETLLTTPALVEVDRLLSVPLQGYHYVGYTVVTADNIIIASNLKLRVGTLLPLHELLGRVFAGETLLSPPLFPEIFPIPVKLGQEDLFMFSAAPIRDTQGKIVAALLFHIDPSRDFIRITGLGKVDETGETFVFDKNGRLLTPSRFLEQLLLIGLIPLSDEKKSIHFLEVRDPGGNMLEGFRPSVPLAQWPLIKAVQEAIAGKSGMDLDGLRDYRGVPVVSTWLWDEKLGFGLATKIDEVEAYAAFRLTRALTLSTVGVTIFLFSGLTVVHTFGSRQRLGLLQKLHDKEKHMAAVVDSALDGIITINTQGIIQTFNPAAARIFGYQPDDVVGRNIAILMPDPYGREHDGYIKGYLETGISKIIGVGRELLGRRQDGSIFPLHLSVNRMAGDPLFVGIVRDITGQKQAEESIRKSLRNVKLLQVTAVAANEARTVTEALQSCLDSVCQIIGWPVGHAYFPREGGGITIEEDQVLAPELTTLWHITEPDRYREFREITEKTRFGPGVGLPGRVLTSGKPEWIVDVTLDENFPRAKGRPDLGVRAGFAFPVHLGGSVVAVLEFFSASAVDRDDSFLETLNHMGIQLSRVAERKRMENALSHSQEQLRQLTSRLQSAQEKERENICREIHDELGQALTVIKMNLSWMAGRIPPHQMDVLNKMQVMTKLADDTIDAMRRIASGLRPRVLDDLGLKAAIEWHTSEIQRRTGIKCILVNSDFNDETLDRELSIVLFRVCQEALTNVLRHARANTVTIILKGVDGEIAMDIEDDGCGIDEDRISNAKSLGILGMSERILAFGGTLKIQGSPDKGTSVRVRIPGKSAG